VIVGLTGFGAAAWQTAPGDQFIGWNHEQPKIYGYILSAGNLEFFLKIDSQTSRILTVFSYTTI